MQTSYLEKPLRFRCILGCGAPSVRPSGLNSVVATPTPSTEHAHGTSRRRIGEGTDGSLRRSCTLNGGLDHYFYSSQRKHVSQWEDGLTGSGDAHTGCQLQQWAPDLPPCLQATWAAAEGHCGPSNASRLGLQTSALSKCNTSHNI